MDNEFNDQNSIAVKVIFKGRVQGVGFRYQTCQIAQRFQITGSVKNLKDGSVELIAQGEKKVVDSFIQSVQMAMDSYIAVTNETDVPFQPALRDFQIVY